MPVVALLVAVLCAAPDPARCTCIPVPEPRSATEMRTVVETTGAVIEGEVLRVEQRVEEVGGDRPMRFRTREVTLRVHRRWRGPAGDTLVVRTAAAGTSCGVDFAVGERWVVFADAPRGGPLWANRCGLTRRVDRATRELALLAEVPRR